MIHTKNGAQQKYKLFQNQALKKKINKCGFHIRKNIFSQSEFEMMCCIDVDV